MWFDKKFDYVHEFIENWNKQVKRLKGIFLLIAAILCLVGVLCIFLPMEGFSLVQLLAAAALVVQGLYFLISFASSTQYFKDPMQIVMGVLNILMGILLLLSPVVLTAATFTFLFAFLLLFSGAEKIAFAAKMRYFQIMNVGLMTFSGVLNILLAVIFLALPMLSILFLNYIIAAYLIVSGVTLFAEALSMKKITDRAAF